MATFLKQKTVPVGDDKVTLTQLSGLDRYDFMDFCSEQTFPESIEALSEKASKEEKEAQLKKMEEGHSSMEPFEFHHAGSIGGSWHELRP